MSRRLKFGTDGWRAVIAEDFTFENVRIIAQAVADYVKAEGYEDKGIAIGYDTRFMSDKFARTIADVVASNGIRVLLSKMICPTPVLSWVVFNRKMAGGIMVTASHNPYYYNGIKFKGAYGGSAMVLMTRAIEAQLGENPPQVKARIAKANTEIVDFFPEYKDHLRQYINFDRINTFKKTVVIDSMYGAGLRYLTALLDESRINLVSIHDYPNPDFAGTLPEPILKNLTDLQEAISKHGADIGFATDGDADRFGMLDKHGHFIELHDLMPILFEYLVQDRKWDGDVVRTTSMHNTIDRMAAKYGRTLIEVPVGFKNVCEQMLTKDILIGGEESGGFGYKNHIPERDGIISSLLVLEKMASTGSDLSDNIMQLRDEYGPFSYGRIDHYFNLEKLGLNMDNLRNDPPDQMNGFRVARVSYIDGIKFYFEENAWMLIRVSQTEPLCRVYVGAEREEHVKKLLESGLERITQV